MIGVIAVKIFEVTCLNKDDNIYKNKNTFNGHTLYTFCMNTY